MKGLNLWRLTISRILILLVSVFVLIISGCSFTSSSVTEIPDSTDSIDLKRRDVPPVFQKTFLEESADLKNMRDTSLPVTVSPPMCHKADLQFARAGRNQAMGYAYEYIVVTNQSNTSCTLPRGDLNARIITDGADQKITVVRDDQQTWPDSVLKPVDPEPDKGAMTVLTPNEQVYVDLSWRASSHPTQGEQTVELVIPVLGSAAISVSYRDDQFMNIDYDGRLNVSQTWRTGDHHTTSQDWYGSNADLDTRTVDEFAYCSTSSLRYRTDLNWFEHPPYIGITIVNYGTDSCRLSRVAALSSAADAKSSTTIPLVVQDDGSELSKRTTDMRFSPGDSLKYVTRCNSPVPSAERWIRKHARALDGKMMVIVPVSYAVPACPGV